MLANFMDSFMATHGNLPVVSDGVSGLGLQVMERGVPGPAAGRAESRPALPHGTAPRCPRAAPAGRGAGIGIGAGGGRALPRAFCPAALRCDSQRSAKCAFVFLL